MYNIYAHYEFQFAQPLSLIHERIQVGGIRRKHAVHRQERAVHHADHRSSERAGIFDDGQF